MWQVVETGTVLTGEDYGQEYEVVRAEAESFAEIEELRVEVWRMDVEIHGERGVDRSAYRVRKVAPELAFRPSVGVSPAFSGVESPEL